jgi:hypothetical protein
MNPKSLADISGSRPFNSIIGTDSLNCFRPPFQIIPGQSAEDAAIEIVDAFISIETLPDRACMIFRTIMDCLAIGHLEPLVVAGFSLCKVVDNVADKANKPYHNSLHTCEVMLSAYFLSLLAGLDKHEIAEIILAALIHDFQHDGKINGETPFRLERNSINAALPYMLTAKITLTQQQKIAALILATDTAIGLNIVRACYAHYIYGDSLPEIPSAAPELGKISEDPKKLVQALILGEADILPSIGLTIEHAFRLQEKLSLEWDVRLGLEDKLQFIDSKFRTFIMGTFFNQNIDKLRLEILHRLQKLNHET